MESLESVCSKKTQVNSGRFIFAQKLNYENFLIVWKQVQELEELQLLSLYEYCIVTSGCPVAHVMLCDCTCKTFHCYTRLSLDMCTCWCVREREHCEGWRTHDHDRHDSLVLLKKLFYTNKGYKCLINFFNLSLLYFCATFKTLWLLFNTICRPSLFSPATLSQLMLHLHLFIADNRRAPGILASCNVIHALHNPARVFDPISPAELNPGGLSHLTAWKRHCSVTAQDCWKKWLKFCSSHCETRVRHKDVIIGT